MKLKRITRLWTNPRTKHKGYVVKYAIESQGAVDLVSSYCIRTQCDHMAVTAIVDGLSNELVQLLCKGYLVNIKGVGVVYLRLDAEQFDYADAKKCQVDSVKGVRLKLIKSAGFRNKLKESLNSAIVL